MSIRNDLFHRCERTRKHLGISRLEFAARAGVPKYFFRVLRSDYTTLRVMERAEAFCDEHGPEDADQENAA